MRGRLLDGRYELLERLGAGGMGEVWRARDRSLGREVAVKVFVPPERSGADEPAQLLARFRQEARAAASLDSPYIVAVHDHGTDGDTAYLVMALVQGRSLDRVLRESIRVPVADALRWAADICRALDAAHSAGVVHRDIKPGNVMIAPDGTAKLVDFGIATFMEGVTDDSRLTRTGQLPFGSVPYLAPERFRQETGDGRTDLYALGCVLYELLVGRPPFTGTAAGVMYNHVNDAPLRPSRARAEVPAPVERLVLDLLAKNPADRPGDAGAVLERILGMTGAEAAEGAEAATGATAELADAALAEATPADAAPDGAPPADVAPADANPADANPANPSPARVIPAGAAPSDAAPANPSPAGATPADASPDGVEPVRHVAGRPATADVQDAVPRSRPSAAVRKDPATPEPRSRRSRARRLLIPAALVLAVGIPAGLGIRSLAASDTGSASGTGGSSATYTIGVAHSYTHVGAEGSGGGGDTYERSEFKQFTTQQKRTVESAFAEALGAKSGSRFRVVPVVADPDTTSRELLAEHPDMLAVIGDTVDFSWVHDTDEAFLPEISTCYDVAHPDGAFAIPPDEARQGEAMGEYLLTRTGARRVLVAEDKIWADREDGVGTGLRKAGVSAEALDVSQDKVRTSQIPGLVAGARADAVVVPTGTDIAVWAKKLRASGFTGPVLTQSRPNGVCEDSKERASSKERDKPLPEGIVRTRNYSGEPDDNLPARGNQELYDGALALATALEKLPAEGSATSLRHTLDREIQGVSVNGVLAEVSFEKRRSARERPVWFDRRDGDAWTEIGKVEKKYEPTKQ
ncbi:protein kinase domain-containing protein [Streptomyces sp. SYP-A7185]|uniref:serine/threonine-protein kinase n=1 Tax=Streptomyces sp. SYP-A7185 TaxID=3040076 RepID=UPI0038F7F0E2